MTQVCFTGGCPMVATISPTMLADLRRKGEKAMSLER